MKKDKNYITEMVRMLNSLDIQDLSKEELISQFGVAINQVTAKLRKKQEKQQDKIREKEKKIKCATFMLGCQCYHCFNRRNNK